MKIWKSIILIIPIIFFVKPGEFTFFANVYKFLDSRYTDIYSSLFKKNISTGICVLLQDKLSKIIDNNNPFIALTVLDSSFNIIADVNGSKLFIPASNQKIFSTAFALHKKGPNFTLRTKLFKNNKGYFEIIGMGDPDISQSDINNFIKYINNNQFLSYSSSPLILYEEPKKYWWPDSWALEDRNEDYGAPITRLAVDSNTATYPNIDPLNNFKLFSYSALNNNGLDINIITKNHNILDNKSNRKLIFEKKSAPLFMLLNLANSESHNFTSEVLLRATSNSWSNSISIKKLRDWIISIGVESDEIVFADGSGLSRNNKTTTNAITHVLAFMNNHRYRDYFISSMSYLGLRGTLRNQYQASDSSISFLGKSGTLSNVRSLSGYLYTPNGLRIISIIQNNDILDHSIFTKILSTINSDLSCN